ASHNPPHDNGYKVYFSDGAQVVEPHASGIIARVNAIAGETFTPLPPQQRGKIITISTELDEAYIARLQTLVLDPEILRQAHSLRVIFTPIHGTGGVITKPIFTRLGIQFHMVPEQELFDGPFSTVKSTN